MSCKVCMTFLKKKKRIEALQLRKPDPKTGEGNGNPLQYSCPETPMDGGAW